MGRRMQGVVAIVGSFFLLTLCTSVFALTYRFPSEHEAVMGTLQRTHVMHGDSLERISREYSVGYNELVAANRHVNPKQYLRLNQSLTIPTLFIVPRVKREGIVVNLAEMRLYFFPKDQRYVMTFPVGIGKIGKTIPLGKARVINKKEKPKWRPTANIRAYNEARGVFLPEFIPPGPDNPLGPYAIYLSFPEYLIHSTIHPTSIGKRSSFGCIRMYEEDVEQLFARVGRNVPVHVVDEPVKAGWKGDQLYLEVHPLLKEEKFHENKSMAMHVEEVLADYQGVHINHRAVDAAIDAKNGIPVIIGTRGAQRAAAAETPVDA